jgi:hypothetical protein
MRPACLIVLGFSTLLLSGCYVPTRERVCLDLGADRGACRSNAMLHDRLASKFPTGMTDAQLKNRLNEVFAPRLKSLRVSNDDGTRTVVIPYEVEGFAVCKETVVVAFRFEGEKLADFVVDTPATCL